MLSRLRNIVALMRDPRVSKFPKFLVVAAILYLLMPFDLIPDVAPVVGWLDDLVFLIGALSLLLNAAPRSKPVAPKGPIIDVTPEPKPPEARP